MKINNIIVGPLETNCYILSIDNKTLIIDPGDEGDKIINSIDQSNDVIGIIITHSHFDHIGAVDELVDKYNSPVFSKNNLKEGLNTIGPFSFDVIYTPGHLDDGISLYFKEDKLMFVGDFIFNGSIGRVDMPGSSISDMKNSIAKILTYPKDITIMPGHGPSTTLNDEINSLNYYLDLLQRI